MQLKRPLTAVLIWLLAGGLALGQPVPPVQDAPPSLVDEWLCPACPVTAGDCKVTPSLWQRTWGIAGGSIFPSGRKMAPNGIVFQPLFDLDMLLNIGLTSDRSVYLFTKARFWGQKPDPDGGITNANQGRFDFSKRQFDLDAGVAWNYLGRLEGRVFVYSDNNLNRGIDLERPYGFNDGLALEHRYYLPSTNFDRGLYRYLSVGSYITKELVGSDGKLFKPTAFLAGSLALDLLPEQLYTYLDYQLIARRPVRPKLMLTDVGVAFRPFEKAPDLEFRLGAESTYDMQRDRNRTLLYTHLRIVW